MMAITPFVGDIVQKGRSVFGSKAQGRGVDGTPNVLAVLVGEATGGVTVELSELW